MIKRYMLIIMIIFFTAPAYCQIIFQFIPEISGRNVNGLFNVRITNPFQKLSGTLTITVTERKAGIICTIKTPEFTILPGTNPISVTAAHSASVLFANNRLGQLTGLNSTFPEGDYDYCYSLSFSHSDNPPEEQCFAYTLAPFSDMNLIDPYDKDSVCNKRPLFSWEPLIPGVPGSYYQLVLAEIKTGQNPTEALNYNLPIINQSSIVSPVLPYPAIDRELETDKRYAWQVTAYKDQTVLNRSEIWEFKVHCTDTSKIIPKDGYRDIEDLLKGNFYIATGYIKFVLVNPYQSQDLKYEISPITNPGKKIKQLPSVKLKNGHNNVIIDLSGNTAFTGGAYYMLNVWLPNGIEKSLRFLYEENKN